MGHFVVSHIIFTVCVAVYNDRGPIAHTGSQQLFIIFSGTFSGRVGSKRVAVEFQEFMMLCSRSSYCGQLGRQTGIIGMADDVDQRVLHDAQIGICIVGYSAVIVDTGGVEAGNRVIYFLQVMLL